MNFDNHSPHKEPAQVSEDQFFFDLTSLHVIVFQLNKIVFEIIEYFRLYN